MTTMVGMTYSPSITACDECGRPTDAPTIDGVRVCGTCLGILLGANGKVEWR